MFEKLTQKEIVTLTEAIGRAQDRLCAARISALTGRPLVSIWSCARSRARSWTQASRCGPPCRSGGSDHDELIMQYETNTNAMSYISQIGGSIAALTEVAGDLAALGADGMTLTDNQRARINEALAGVHMAMFRVRQELNRLPAAESALDRLTRAAAPSSTSSTAATRSDVLWHDPDLHRRAGTSRAGPVVIGPFADVASEVVREEVDAWGWTVLSGSARKLTLSQAGREATTCATCGGRLDWVDDAWCRRSCGDEFCR